MPKGSTPLRPPEEAYLHALKIRMETEFHYQDIQIDRAREVRELRQPIPLDRDMLLVPGLQIHDPTATSTGFQTGDTLSLNPPTIRVIPPNRESDRAEKLSDRMAAWSSEVLKQSGRLPLSMHAFAAKVDSAANDGAGWSKIVWRPDLWAARNRLRLAQFDDKDSFEAQKEAAKQAAGVPFAWRVPDVRTVYPVFYGDDIGEVIEITQRPESQLFRQYRLARSETGSILLPEEVRQGIPVNTNYTNQSLTTSSGMIQFLEHWDAEFVTYMAVGKRLDDSPEYRILKQWRHHYDRVPYFPAMGLMMNHWRNRKVGWGSTEAMRFLVELRSFLWTLMGNAAARDTFPLLQEVLVAGVGPSAAAIGTQGDDQRGELIQTVRWGLREILKARVGYEYKPLPMPPVAESIKVLMTAVDAALQRLEAPRFNGDLGGLEGAGFAINQVLSYESVRLGRIKQQLEDSLEEMVRFYWHLVRVRVQEKVWIYNADVGTASGWLGLGPEELQDTVNLEVRLNPEQPSAKLIDQRMIHEAIEKGTLSLDQGIELLGRSPDEVRRGRRMDQLRQSPLYNQLADQALLAELGRGDLMTLVLQAQALATGGNPAHGIPPPGAGISQQMGNSLLPNANQLMQPPSPGAPTPQQGLRVGVPGMAGPPAASQPGLNGAQPMLVR